MVGGSPVGSLAADQFVFRRKRKMAAKAETPSSSMTRLVFGFIPSRAVYAVAKLGIPDLMRDGPRSPGDLARLLNIDPDALFRIMRLLAGSGVLRQGGDGLFSLTSLGETLCSNANDSLRDWVILAHEGFYPTLANRENGFRFEFRKGLVRRDPFRP
jgi:hypothetical protein